MLAIAATENQQTLSPSNSNHQFRSIHPRQIQSRHTHAGVLARRHPRQHHDSHRSRVWRPPLPSVLLAKMDPSLLESRFTRIALPAKIGETWVARWIAERDENVNA